MKLGLFTTLLLLTNMALAQLPKPWTFNTASEGEAVGNNDQHWKVATSLGGPYVPATVVGNCDAQWFSSGATNANWVSLDNGNGCYHSGDDFDQYFQRNILLPASNDCGLPVNEVFCFEMDFYADNCIREVLVNGVKNYDYMGSDTDCDNLQHVVIVPLCDGWQPGQNSLTIHVKSTPPAIGLLAIARPLPTLSDDFLGRDTFLCSATSYEITSPDAQTRWFDGSVGPSTTVGKSGQYWAARKNAEGCDLRDTVSVVFPAVFYIPNAFSPNGDGINDSFAPAFAELPLLPYQLLVFDRWGSLVFETHDPSMGWEGEQRGAGVYAYLIVAGGKGCKQMVSGDVLLVK